MLIILFISFRKIGHLDDFSEQGNDLDICFSLTNLTLKCQVNNFYLFRENLINNSETNQCIIY